ncbi:MAG: SDR family NAD(P)-dependent oxidoreductase [Arenicella sp.]|nr:SDR family NAD(P)-dependent oxidoreductase [Arenicella sp.]
MQSILVTGANKGIGLAVVKAILSEQQQFRVLLGSRDLERGEAARDEALGDTGVDAERLAVVAIDVGDERSVAEAATGLQNSDDELYGLVNNAGIASGSLTQILNVNVNGVQRVCEKIIPLMPNGGRVVNVASASGPNFVSQCASEWQQFFQNEQLTWPELSQFMQHCLQMTASEMQQKGLPADGYYGLSKACANLFTLISARENPRLTINACTPGYIETDLTRGMTGASGTSAAELGMKQPEDGARVIMHLLFKPVEGTGYYYGSDALRSPLDRYRSPGSPAYTGD